MQIAALAAVLFAAPLAPLRAQPWTAVSPPRLEKPHPAVARVIAHEQGAVSCGSGTLVHVEGEYGLVVTNWHVVRDATGEIRVVFPDGFQSPATVARLDRDWDLAALVVYRPNVQPVPLAAAAPQIGEPLTIAGYGSGDYLAQHGRCTQYVAPAMNLPLEMVEVSAQARQGDSGGPIFNDRGELAGVLWGASPPDPFAVNRNGTTSGSYSERVRRFLVTVAPRLGQGDVSNIAAREATSDPMASLPAAPRVTARGALPADTAKAAAAASLFEPPPPHVAPVNEPVASLGMPMERELKSLATHPRPVAPPQITARGSAERSGTSQSSLEPPPSIASQPPVVAQPDDGSDAKAASSSSATATLAAAEAPNGSGLLEKLTHQSLIEQAKTFLAIFGVIAFAYHAVRMVAREQ